MIQQEPKLMLNNGNSEPKLPYFAIVIIIILIYLLSIKF